MRLKTFESSVSPHFLYRYNTTGHAVRLANSNGVSIWWSYVQIHMMNIYQIHMFMIHMIITYEIYICSLHIHWKYICQITLTYVSPDYICQCKWYVREMYLTYENHMAISHIVFDIYIFFWCKTYVNTYVEHM